MTATDYLALRWHLDALAAYRLRPMHWPHVPVSSTGPGDQLASFTAGGRGDDAAIAARAAWWSALTAPVREAEADEVADREALALFSMPGALSVIERLPAGTRFLRARLCIDGLFDKECHNCQGSGSWWYRTGAGEIEMCDCTRCRGAGRLPPATPLTDIEAVPQADPARGIEPCGCRGKDARCKWCAGTGRVRDGRANGENDYDPGGRWPSHMAMRGSSTHGMYATAPEARDHELAHRREQPDAFGHPYSMPLSPRPELSTRRGRLLPTRLRYGTLARAPLGETLHFTPSAGEASSARTPRQTGATRPPTAALRAAADR